MFKRKPKLLCGDSGWMIARDKEDGSGTEYLFTLLPEQTWISAAEDAMYTRDHAEALDWLDIAEKSG